jgi:hypothetical protein
VIRGAGGRPGFARRANYTLEREPAEYGSVGSLALLDVDGDGRRDLVVARESTPTLDDGVVVYRREANGFAAGAALPGLADLANAEEPPLRLGR